MQQRDRVRSCFCPFLVNSYYIETVDITSGLYLRQTQVRGYVKHMNQSSKFPVPKTRASSFYISASVSKASVCANLFTLCYAPQTSRIYINITLAIQQQKPTRRCRSIARIDGRLPA